MIIFTTEIFGVDDIRLSYLPVSMPVSSASSCTYSLKRRKNFLRFDEISFDIDLMKVQLHLENESRRAKLFYRPLAHSCLPVFPQLGNLFSNR